MMKKFFVIFFSFFLLAGTSFGAGAFLAHKKTSIEIKADEIKIVENTDKIITEASNENENFSEKDSPNNETDAEKENAGTTQETTDNENKPEFSFAILGDTQYFKPGIVSGYQMAIGNIKKLNPQLVFATGDLVSSCDGKSECEGKYRNWKNILGDFSSKTYTAQGNHDRTEGEKSDSVWEREFSYLPGNGPQGFVKFAYSFDFQNSHFVVLDSEKPKENTINDTQKNWLERDLSSTKKENIFVFFHEPAYPTNSKIGESLDVDPGSRNILWNIMTNHKVTAVFAGHEHIQSRRKVNGLYQFGFGNTDSFNHLAPRAGMAEYSYVGPAFGLVEISGTDITVKTYSTKGNLLNSFKFPG